MGRLYNPLLVLVPEAKGYELDASILWIMNMRLMHLCSMNTWWTFLSISIDSETVIVVFFAVIVHVDLAQTRIMMAFIAVEIVAKMALDDGFMHDASVVRSRIVMMQSF
jgi:hypothetical protein